MEQFLLRREIVRDAWPNEERQRHREDEEYARDDAHCCTESDAAEQCFENGWYPCASGPGGAAPYSECKPLAPVEPLVDEQETWGECETAAQSKQEALHADKLGDAGAKGCQEEGEEAYE
jgi:hypothetical protein